MNIAFIQTKAGQASKASLEAAGFAAGIGDTVAVVSGELNGDGGLGAVGVTRVLQGPGNLDDGQIAKLVAAAADKEGASLVVCAQDHLGKAVAGRVAVRLGAGLIAGVTSAPDGGSYTRNVFSGKATARVQGTTDKLVVTTTPNAIGMPEAQGGTAAVEAFDTDLGASKVEVLEAAQPSGGDRAPLPEAELVVSAGRGLKGPENWGIIEDLADSIGATTACSRPVSDIGWRPHHEHVGQTGIAIRPNLYIAVGISGAIQHLAGVNGSKVIVVVNKDPEAPFFKAADYGIVGDAFEVIPKLTEAFKAL
ncbi:MAG: electron transfer flavoprotein subunit alpha/FixB family protein [Crocinitomicaceae bacterium TMED114]|nr:MAG: electron transfer flavoprotein subunit alpha/FixB family protein [Crocinitomicaceae bacterium TMED114]